MADPRTRWECHAIPLWCILFEPSVLHKQSLLALLPPPCYDDYPQLAELAHAIDCLNEGRFGITPHRLAFIMGLAPYKAFLDEFNPVAHLVIAPKSQFTDYCQLVRSLHGLD